MVERIGPQSLSGHSHLHRKLAADILKPMLIDQAKRAMVAANIAAFTDNGGGAAADGTIAAIVTPPAFTETGTASAQKAGFETALGTVKDAITECGAKLAAINAVVPAADFTDNSGGTTADGTIGAITVALTGVNTSIASYAGTVTVATNIKNAIATLAFAVNKVRYALGLSQIVDNSGGSVLHPNTIPALSVGTGTAVDGTALSGISEVGGEAFLTGCADALKELSTAIGACRAVTAPAAVTVVAAPV